MLFRQFLHEDLGCASYLIADSGEAAVVDPKWEIGEYLALARKLGVEIAHVLETHNHADHLSGHGRLAAETGATIHAPAKAGARYPHEPIEDGALLRIGKASIEAVATPGHRPEHTAYLLRDESRADEPWSVLTGDSLFVGDLARPDLAVEPEEGARELFHSLRRLFELADHVEVWPGHIGGSLCGGSGTSEKPQSTIGFERRHNRFLGIEDQQAFVDALTSELAPQPPNFERILELNRGPLLADVAPLELLDPARTRELLDLGAVLVDGRAPREYDVAHMPGSLNVTAVATGVGTRAAWVVAAETRLVVTAADEDTARGVARLLEAVGLRGLQGVLAGGVDAWQEAGFQLETTEAIDVPTLAQRLDAGEVALLDVRENDEWRKGHVAGSLHVPYYELHDGLPQELGRELDGRPLAVACSAGIRSAVAASLLRRAGLEDVQHVVDGGIEDLPDEGIELVEAPAGADT